MSVRYVFMLYVWRGLSWPLAVACYNDSSARCRNVAGSRRAQYGLTVIMTNIIIFPLSTGVGSMSIDLHYCRAHCLSGLIAYWAVRNAVKNLLSKSYSDKTARYGAHVTVGAQECVSIYVRNMTNLIDSLSLSLVLSSRPRSITR